MRKKGMKSLANIERLTDKRIGKILKFLKNKKVIVAASGGKDSMFLLYKLYYFGVKFSILHLYFGYGKFSDEQLKVIKKFANEYGIELYVENLSYLNIPTVAKLKGRKVCSVCGIVKRYFFNKLAREHGYEILVTAHNLTDIYRFLLVNLASGSLEYSARNLPFKKPAHPKQVIFVKPLYYVPETWIEMLVNKYQIEYAKEKCPYVERNYWKEIVRSIEEIDPNILYTSVKFFVKKYSKYIPINEEKLTDCKICGEPTTSKDRVCTFCRLFRINKIYKF